MVRMSSAPRGGGGYGGLLGMTSGSGSSSGQYRSSYSKQGSSYLGIVVGLSAMSILVIFIIYYLISSPVKFDEAEAEALAKFIVRSLGDALPDLHRIREQRPRVLLMIMQRVGAVEEDRYLSLDSRRPTTTSPRPQRVYHVPIRTSLPLDMLRPMSRSCCLTC